MILVYTPRITARFNFIFRHIFNNILQIEVKFTTKIEEFIAFNGAKFSYAPQALGNEFHIHSHKILYQHGIKDVDIVFFSWNKIPVFFETPDSSIPFDIFAASFFLLSRYEEYFPNQQLDEHGRYDYKNSVLYKNNLLEQPIVEIWVQAFKQKLQERFPDLIFPNTQFYFEPLINVSMARTYQHKAFLRNFFGGLNDLAHLRLISFWRRNRVVVFGKKDPYDTFDEIVRLKKKYRHPLTFFHLLSNYSLFDHNISKNKNAYRTQIKFLADHADTGLLSSYYAWDNEEKIAKEIKEMESIIHKQLLKVRAHFNRIKIPVTYQFFNKEELKYDYSMGYNHKIGFRAGTSIPFNFYDIENENETGLLLHPTTISDIMLRHQYEYAPKQAVKILIEHGNLIKTHNGHFYPIFHNFILANNKEWKKWNRLYTETLKHFSNAKT